MQKTLGLVQSDTDNPYYAYQQNTESSGENDENSSPYENMYAPSGMYSQDKGGYNPPAEGGYNPPAEAESTEHTYWKKSGSMEYDADELLDDLKN